MVIKASIYKGDNPIFGLEKNANVASPVENDNHAIAFRGTRGNEVGGGGGGVGL